MNKVLFSVMDVVISLFAAVLTAMVLFYCFKFKVNKEILVESIIGVGAGAAAYNIKAKFPLTKRISADVLVGVVGCIFIVILLKMIL